MLACRDQCGAQATGVEDAEVVKHQKILNNLFSLLTVVLHMAYTFQFALHDHRGKWVCKVLFEIDYLGVIKIAMRLTFAVSWGSACKNAIYQLSFR